MCADAVSGAPATVSRGRRGGGGAPAALGGGGRVVEHRWEVGELVGESIWVEEGRKG